MRNWTLQSALARSLDPLFSPLFPFLISGSASCGELTSSARVVFKASVLPARSSTESHHHPNRVHLWTRLRACAWGCKCVCAGQQLNRPEVLRWAETVSRGSPVRSDAPRIPDSGDRPRRGKEHHGNDNLYAFYGWIPAVRGARQVRRFYVSRFSKCPGLPHAAWPLSAHHEGCSPASALTDAASD